MGKFNKELLIDLGKLADPKDDNSMDPDPNQTFGFSPQAVLAVEKFKNALFKAFMLRAHNCYVATHQGALKEAERIVTANFAIKLTSASVHPGSEDPRLKALGVITSVYPGLFDDVTGGADVPDLIGGFNSQGGAPPIYALACK